MSGRSRDLFAKIEAADAEKERALYIAEHGHPPEIMALLNSPDITGLGESAGHRSGDALPQAFKAELPPIPAIQLGGHFQQRLAATAQRSKIAEDQRISGRQSRLGELQGYRLSGNRDAMLTLRDASLMAYPVKEDSWERDGLLKALCDSFERKPQESITPAEFAQWVGSASARISQTDLMAWWCPQLFEQTLGAPVAAPTMQPAPKNQTAKQRGRKFTYPTDLVGQYLHLKRNKSDRDQSVKNATDEKLSAWFADQNPGEGRSAKGWRDAARNLVKKQSAQAKAAPQKAAPNLVRN